MLGGSRTIIAGSILCGILFTGCQQENLESTIEKPSTTSTTTTLPPYDVVGQSLAEYERLKLNEFLEHRRREAAKEAHERSHRHKVVAASAKSSPVPASDDVWYRLFGCETGYTYNAATNTGNGYYGAFQFSATTWRGIGESGLPHQFSYEHQRAAAQRLQLRDGWKPWPACSRKLGLR